MYFVRASCLIWSGNNCDAVVLEEARLVLQFGQPKKVCIFNVFSKAYVKQ
jgi:hypothetical protein